MNYEPGTLVDTDSIHRALGGRGFDELTRKLQDQWAARVYFSKQRQQKAAHLRQQIQYAANEQMGGMRPVLHLDKVARAWLDIHYPGWQEDDEFERDLIRHHPETAIKLKTGGATNRVGWTAAAESGGMTKPEGQNPKVVNIVLADKRGHIEDAPKPAPKVVNPHRRKSA